MSTGGPTQPRPSRIAHDLSQRMAVPAPEALPRFDAGGQGPASLVNFDIRLAGGALPVSGAAVPELVAWARHVDARDVDPAVALLALGDCLPPAALDAFTAMAPVSSMTWTIDLAQPAASGEWFLLRSTSLHAADGYSFQTMEIRDAAGALAACGSQTVALFA